MSEQMSDAVPADGVQQPSLGPMPRPVAFAFSGGGGQGAIQVGMLKALADAGLSPDLVAGTSVGALHAAVVAEDGHLPRSTERLERIWHDLRRRNLLPRSWPGQALSVWRTGHLHSSRKLRRLIGRTLTAQRFDQLRLPLTVVTAEVMTGHVRWLTEGQLAPALLAATALPGIFPPVTVDDRLLWDAGSVANVPLQPAITAGAGSLVVLDAGDACHLDAPPRGIPDALFLALRIALRQRVLVETPTVAERLPVLYLPRPCVTSRQLLDFDRSHEMIEPSRQMVATFLAGHATPTAGRMSGGPHTHDEADPLVLDAGPTPIPRRR